MTDYRNMLTEQEDIEVGSVVGCGLDRLGKNVTENKITMAVAFYKNYRDEISKFTIHAQRDLIREFIESGGILPDVLID